MLITLAVAPCGAILRLVVELVGTGRTGNLNRRRLSWGRLLQAGRFVFSILDLERQSVYFYHLNYEVNFIKISY